MAGAKDALLFEIINEKSLLLDALAFRTKDGFRLIAANLQPVKNELRLENLPDGSAVLRRLNEDTFDQATSDPGGFLKSNGTLSIRGGTADITFKPYETVFIELHTEPR